MLYDYFLLHRGLQIQRLCEPDRAGGIQLPDEATRAALSRVGASVVAEVQEIRRLRLSEEQDPASAERWWTLPARLLQRRSASEADPGGGALLTAAQREVIDELESDLVRARLSDNAADQRLAAMIIDALLRDRKFFNGLKPLAEHSEQFAFEFLYPTWLNLYTVVARRDARQPAWSDQQVQTLFSLLDEHERRVKESDRELLGLLTFLARRLPTEKALCAVQRVWDLCRRPGCDLAAAAVTVLTPMRDEASGAKQLLEVVEDYLTVEWTLQHRGTASAGELHPLPASPAPLPAAMERMVREMAYDGSRFAEYASTLRHLASVLENNGYMEADFTALVEDHGAMASQLLALLVTGERASIALKPGAQRMLAHLMRGEQRGQELPIDQVSPFAHQIAPRMNHCDSSFCSWLVTDLLAEAANRQLLLGCVADRSRRQRFAAQLVERARKTEDRGRFLNLVELAAILDPAMSDSQVTAIEQSATVLRRAFENQSITGRQSSELLDDLRQQLPESLAYLESPAAIAANKPERLARLYLTLNQLRESYISLGTVGNFGATYASYGVLGRVADAE